jgi:hypothetical protein
MTSMFQTSSVAIRAIAGVAWQHIYTSTATPPVLLGAAVMAVSY